MPNDLLKMGALFLGAVVLFGGNRQQGLAGVFAGNAGSAVPVSVPAQTPLPGLTTILRGLFAASGDEDIGIAPVLGIAAPSPTGEDGGGGFVVEDSNTPVIDQTPIFVDSSERFGFFNVVGSNEEGFALTGSIAGITGETVIIVNEFGGGADITTTPDVLAQFLLEQGPPL